MATEVSNEGSASCSKTNPFSYANAVLNSKNKHNVANQDNKPVKEDEKVIPSGDDKSNKENENVNKENVNIPNTIEEKPSDVKVDSSNNEANERDDDFIDYNSSKRKKKMAKTKKKEVAFKPHATVLSRNSPVKHDRIRERRRDKQLVNGDENESNSVSCDIKYVEAPVPKVNPWTIKRNTPSLVKGDNQCLEKQNSADGECLGIIMLNLVALMHSILFTIKRASFIIA